MASLWQQKKSEIEEIQKLVAASCAGKNDVELLLLIQGLAGQLAEYLPAKDRRRWLAKLREKA